MRQRPLPYLPCRLSAWALPTAADADASANANANANADAVHTRLCCIEDKSCLLMQLLLGSGCGHSSSQRVAKDGGVLVNASAVNITRYSNCWHDTLHSSRGVRVCVLPTASVCIRKLIWLDRPTSITNIPAYLANLNNQNYQQAQAQAQANWTPAFKVAILFSILPSHLEPIPFSRCYYRKIPLNVHAIQSTCPRLGHLLHLPLVNVR